MFEVIDRAIKEIGYSDRGELEITDINRLFMEMDRAKGCSFDCHWADCGTVDALLETSIMMKEWDMGAMRLSIEEEN